MMKKQLEQIFDLVVQHVMQVDNHIHVLIEELQQAILVQAGTLSPTRANGRRR